MPLTEQQESALTILDWLLDPSEYARRSGRSYVIAISLIRQATRYPGIRVMFIDHHGARQSVDYMQMCIQQLLDADPGITPHQYSLGHGYLEFHETILDWMPDSLPLQEEHPPAETILERLVGENLI